MGRYDFTATGGEQKTLDLTWQTTGEPPVPYDLTGCSAAMEFRRDADAPLIARVTSDDDIQIQPGGVEGLVRVILKGNITKLLSDNGVEYVSGYRYLMHDVFVEFPNGDVRQVVYGRVQVMPSITNASNLPEPEIPT